MLSLSILSVFGCIAEDHEPPAPQVPGALEHEDGDWAVAEPTRDAQLVAMGDAVADRGPIGRSDPRPLPSVTGTALQAALDLTEQELGVEHPDLARAELLMRRAELSIARGADGDRPRALASLRELMEPGYVDYARRDDALFYLAWELREAGEMEGVRQVVMELVRGYPNSRWIPETYVVFADFYFDDGKPENAAKFYEKVAHGFPHESVAVYATYRWGWCELVAGDPTRALERFVSTLERAGERSDPDIPRVLEAARRDLTLAYARVGKPSKAWPFFLRIGRGPGEEQHTAAMARALVTEYQALGRPEDATTVCRDLVRHVGRVPECSAG